MKEMRERRKKERERAVDEERSIIKMKKKKTVKDHNPLRLGK